MIEEASGPKGREIFWNDMLEKSFKEINRIVYTETLLNYLYWTIPFTVHTDASDKQFGAIISHNNKPILFYQLD